MLDVVLFLLGLGGVLLGAEWLVRGAARLGVLLGVAPVVIGLTLVAFGTSAPEMAVSGLASAQGHPETAIGNVLGSNIANLGLVLGIAAIITPLSCHRGMVRRDVPLMLGLSFLFLALAHTGTYERWMGAAMLAGLAVYLFFAFRAREAIPLDPGVEITDPLPREAVTRREVLRSAGFVVAGLVLLIGGGIVLVDSAEAIALRLGVSELVVAATLVAVGTSVPEMAATFLAAIRRHADIAVGGIIGSNIFNLLAVVGIGASVRPIEIASDVRNKEFLWMVGFAVLAAVVARTGYRIGRREGLVLFGAYVVFSVVVFL